MELKKYRLLDSQAAQANIIKKSKLKYHLGGYEYEWEIDLPDVVITCNPNIGTCWECQFVMSGEFTGYCRQFTGKMKDYCSAYIKCKDL